MKKTYFELTAGLANPWLDKRCKYGIRSIKSFVKGTRFICRDLQDGTKKVLTLSEGYQSEHIFEDTDFWRTLFRLLKETQPTFTEIARDYIFSYDHALQILRALADTGKIEVWDIIAAAEQLDKEDDEKQKEN